MGTKKKKEYNLPDVKKPESQVKESKITTLDPKHQRFIHLYLTGQYTLAELANLLNVHVNTVRNWLKKDEIKEIINEYQKDEHQIVEQTLKALRFKALSRLAKIIDSPVDGVALQAVNSILDRTGHKSKQQKDVNINVTTFEKQITDLIDKTIKDEEVIDVEGYEVVDGD